MNNKISPLHLARKIFIYIRQSTMGQVINNKESQLLQYGLVERAKKLGWVEEKIILIDNDLAHSAGGTIRSGFDYMLEEICAQNVGAVLSVSDSRLARNGREWHTLLEYCGIVGTLLIDQENIYDLKSANDRLLLGFKGEFNELELRTFRERSQAAIKSKAQRGELYLIISAGYIKSHDNSLIKDPNRRVQESIELVFEKFQQLGSVRQTHKWFLEHKIEIPIATYKNRIQEITWKIASVISFSHIFENPIYAGAYAYGRTKRIIEIRDGRKHIRKGIKQPIEDWDVLIKDHHEGYISWQQYEKNQDIIAHNTNRKRPIAMGSTTGSGHALLSGLLRCGHCGNKLTTRYQGNLGKVIRYVCAGRDTLQGKRTCMHFGGARVDLAVSACLLEAFSADGLEIARRSIEALSHNQSQVLKQRLLTLEQARYDAQRAKRQYDAAEPENRLVTSTLEKQWEEALKKTSSLEIEIAELESQICHLSEQEKKEIISLSENLPYVWNHSDSSPSIKRNIVRIVIKEIIASVENGFVKLKIHWQGGDHTETSVLKNKSGQTNSILDEDILQTITALARMMPDQYIAGFLNRQNKRTATGLTWTAQRVCSVRKDYRIAVYKEGEREARSELTIDEVCTELDISPSKVRKLIKKGIIPAKQVCCGAPWIIKRESLQTETVRKAAAGESCGRPLTPNSKQRSFNFQ